MISLGWRHGRHTLPLFVSQIQPPQASVRSESEMFRAFLSHSAMDWRNSAILPRTKTRATRRPHSDPMFSCSRWAEKCSRSSYDEVPAHL